MVRGRLAGLMMLGMGTLAGGGAGASDMAAGLPGAGRRAGLDLALASIRLGEAARLEVTAGLAYGPGPAGDGDIWRADAQDARVAPTVARPPARQAAFTLGARIGLGARLTLDGDLLLAHNPALSPEQAGRVGLTWRF